MISNALPRPASWPLTPASSEPISLLQVDGRATRDTASAIYRQVRQGRRVVAVIGGPGQGVDALAERLEAIGIGASRPRDGDTAFDADVALVQGRETTPVAKISPSRRKKRVAVAGLGVVGGGVLERLAADPHHVVVGALVRNPRGVRDVDAGQIPLFTDPAALLAREPDIIVDALSDPSTALALIRAGLSRGVDVVSAGKQAIGTDLAGLTALARASGARLAYSACVGGGAPLVETVRRARRIGRIARIEGVLNGTCNYILNGLAAGRSLEHALKDAQQAGFAEADPSADLSGLDAAAKLSILAHEAGCPLPVASIPRTPFAPPGGRHVRQVARLNLASRTARVELEALDANHPFANLEGERNAVRVTLEDGRVLFAEGRGAGRIPTVESVLADVADL